VGLLNKKKRRPLRARPINVGCPFCWEWLPEPQSRPAPATSPDCLGGCCGCGAFFVIDAVGRFGGDALLDLQLLAAGGEMDRAIELCDGVNCQIKSKPLGAMNRSFSGRTNEGDHYGPRVWALKLPVDNGT
jgi:hypothetical protein